ncbi:MAG: RlmE family RNA methyltransferase [Thermodesulfobacteriota bacterium]
MKPSRSSAANRWSDHYTRKAKQEDFPARSVYKLQEIQAKFKILRKNASVLDLGCAPGSWLKYAAQLVGPEGRVIGVDRSPVAIALPSQARAMVGDVTDASVMDAVEGRFDVVMSDMAPSTTGQKDVDAARSLELCRIALSIAQDRLLPGGSFVCKIFQGEDVECFVREVKDLFLRHAIFKPSSCRKASKEIYIIGIGKKSHRDPASDSTSFIDDTIPENHEMFGRKPCPATTNGPRSNTRREPRMPAEGASSPGSSRS